MNVVAVTQKGFKKEENEDRILIGKSVIASGAFQTKEPVKLVAIADGVGGNQAGAVASQFVMHQLAQENCVSEKAFLQINHNILSLSAKKQEYYGMATTLSGICFFPDHSEVFSIGNTRVYTIQSRKYLKQITSDDTTLHFLLSTGQISAESAKSFERKNEITACFGGGSSSLFKMKHKTVEGLLSPFLLTSDGVHDYVSVDQMEEILLEFGWTLEACEQIIAAAYANGSKDDVSIILGEV